MSRLRCAIYSRYSTDRQSPTSVDDQIRKCREHAERSGWAILEEHIYSDEGVSGVGLDRAELRRMLECSLSLPRPFEVVLADDTSRLSRNLADATRIFEKLDFAGIRIVAVSQGIDSQNEQADVLFTVHGLVDKLYVKELAAKTHRGLESRMLRGLHTGGRCFGYRNVKSGEGVRLEVNPEEAQIVRRIFDMSASGLSLKAIAKTLNAESVAPPRPRAGKQYASWCPSAIQAMLRRELYAGKVVWNRSRFIKAPGTNRRLRRARPRSEWRVIEHPELQIVSNSLWEHVQQRLAWIKERYGSQNRHGLLNRAASSRYLLTGFMKCSNCGAHLVIVSGRSGHRHPQYGCPQNFYRGTCSNSLKERHDWLEDRLLRDLQREVTTPQVVDYAVEEFRRQLNEALNDLSGKLSQMQARKAQLEAELQRLTDAIAEQGHSAFLLKAISDRESELQEITERLLSEKQGSIEQDIGEVRRFVSERLSNLRNLLFKDVALARAELSKHVTEIRMEPNLTERHYTAMGEWDLLGRYPKTGRARHLPGVRARMVAGAGFEPATFGL